MNHQSPVKLTKGMRVIVPVNKCGVRYNTYAIVLKVFMRNGVRMATVLHNGMKPEYPDTCRVSVLRAVKESTPDFV